MLEIGNKSDLTTLAARATKSKSDGRDEREKSTDETRYGDKRTMSRRHSVARDRRIASEIRRELEI